MAHSPVKSRKTGFDIRASHFIRHSSLVIRHSAPGAADLQSLGEMGSFLQYW
jgi:hypothetical protein